MQAPFDSSPVVPQIYQLLYTSQAVAPPITLALIQQIERDSAESNALKGLTGLLLATRTWFMQVLEGDIHAVNQVYARIIRDPRHTDVTLLKYGVVPAREFGTWAMKGTIVGLQGKWVTQRLKRVYGEDPRGDISIPLAADQALSVLHDVAEALR